MSSFESSIEVVTQKIELGDVVTFDKAKYNSNNHWENDEMPSDYVEVLNSTRTNHWIDTFRSKYKKIELDYADIAWMKKAYQMGKSTGKFSKCYEDELDQTLEKHQAKTDEIFNSKVFEEFNSPEGFFIRTNNVSLKAGQHGIGPYKSFKQVLESSCSCIHGHTPIDDYTEEVTYYILPWVPLNTDMEFRVFVCNKKITAISQQICYNINKTLQEIETEEKREETMQLWCKIILDYLYSVMESVTVSSFSVDIALVNKRQPVAETATTADEHSSTTPELEAYLIELNCFGKQHAAGSSLFHWLEDEAILYDLNNENKVYFRYIIS